jgi:hypothetical protein
MLWPAKSTIFVSRALPRGQAQGEQVQTWISQLSPARMRQADMATFWAWSWLDPVPMLTTPPITAATAPQQGTIANT